MDWQELRISLIIIKIRIEASFLFVSDGYNFRNTEFSAVLGLSQLKRLDSFIENRRSTYNRFVKIMSCENNRDNFYPIVYNKGNSSFSFPFICKTKETDITLETLIKLVL